jgi:hypothetical protein
VIYTFYSYKGGVGRSMAVANVARVLTRQGIGVVLVDWDLEAPGLESFFCRDDSERESVRQELGLIDLLTSYKAQARNLDLAQDAPVEDVVEVLQEVLPPIVSTLVPIDTSVSAPIQLLTAGWRAGERFPEYAHAVQSFDWNEFYVRYHGEAYFEWLRRQLLAVAPVVLIDSRTGVTEMGGVCTRQLADVVVSFCVPNVQNLGGVADMARSFVRPDIIEQRDRELAIVIVPTRIDGSEIDARNQFRKEFDKTVQHHTPVAFQRHKREFWDLRIPYISKYAYQEKLAVGEDDAAEELATAYSALAAHLALLGSERTPDLNRVWEVYWRSISAPPPSITTLFSVPRRNPQFTGRDDVMGEIAAGISHGGIVVLHGMPGCGKTEAAVEFAYRRSADYDVVWYADASTEETLLDGYRGLADALGLERDASETATLNAVRRWLDRSERWLLILDDSPGPGGLDPYVPRVGGGATLITSRNANWSRFAHPVHVGGLARADAVEFLIHRVREPDKEAASEVAQALGDLPIALELAAAYVETTGQSLREYMQLLDAHGGSLLARGSEGTDADITAVFRAAVDELGRESTPALGLLTLAAFLAPRELHPELVAFALVGLAEPFPPQQAADLTDRLALNDAVGALRRHSLVESEGRGIRFHPVVQALHREQLPPEERTRWAVLALAVSARMLASVDSTSSEAIAGSLLEHVFAALAHTRGAKQYETLESQALQAARSVVYEAFDVASPARAAALRRLAGALAASGELASAEQTTHEAYSLDREIHGEESAEVLEDLVLLGQIMLQSGQHAAAKPWLEFAVILGGKIYGPDDQRTVAMRLAFRSEEAMPSTSAR